MCPHVFKVHFFLDLNCVPSCLFGFVFIAYYIHELGILHRYGAFRSSFSHLAANFNTFKKVTQITEFMR